MTPLAVGLLLAAVFALTFGYVTFRSGFERGRRAEQSVLIPRLDEDSRRWYEKDRLNRAEAGQLRQELADAERCRGRESARADFHFAEVRRAGRQLGYYHELAAERDIPVDAEDQAIAASLGHQLAEGDEVTAEARADSYAMGREHGERSGLARAVAELGAAIERLSPSTPD